MADEHPIDADERRARFEDSMLPHRASAYAVARWLTHSEQDAKDIVQEAFLRALKFFDGFDGRNGRSWLLAIVRNTAYSWLKKSRPDDLEFDEALHTRDDARADPACIVSRQDAVSELRDALESLPLPLREAIVLREMEGLSYKEIASIARVPIGTVMSRLSRARQRLESVLVEANDEESL